MQAGSRFHAVILGLCALIVTSLWLAQVNPYINPPDDSGRYMVLGESLAKTGDLRLINGIHQVRDTLYVPGLPAIIAFWLKVTGRDPGYVVVFVKATLFLMLLGTLPLFAILLRRARLGDGFQAAAMIAYAACPALPSYANEVMSDMPLLFLCLAALVLATTGARLPENPELKAENQPVYCIVGAIACAALAYYVRAAAVIVFISLTIYFWRTIGWRWGVGTLLVAFLVIGSWQIRTNSIIQHDGPGVSHDTYMKQFTLKDPEIPDSGRIQPNILGLGSRIKRCFLPNIGNISRAVIYSMDRKRSAWQVVFYVVAIPFTVLTLFGLSEAWRRGLHLVCGFCVLYWLFVALWPWLNPRFLFPLTPYILVFVFLGAEAFDKQLLSHIPKYSRNLIVAAGMGLLLVYFAKVHTIVITDEHAPTPLGYAMGRSPSEAGFYAAAAWLREKDVTTVVMARPAYLMHLYSGHPTTQIEPVTRPRLQEHAYMLPNRVGYLVVDTWYWSHSDKYLDPYLAEYGSYWTLVWSDPLNSGVRIYRRNN